jgi:hypothetical protein
LFVSPAGVSGFVTGDMRLAAEAKEASRMPTPRVERYEVVYADLGGLADAPEA